MSVSVCASVSFQSATREPGPCCVLSERRKVADPSALPDTSSLIAGRVAIYASVEKSILRVENRADSAVLVENPAPLVEAAVTFKRCAAPVAHTPEGMQRTVDYRTGRCHKLVFVRRLAICFLFFLDCHNILNKIAWSNTLTISESKALCILSGETPSLASACHILTAGVVFTDQVQLAVVALPRRQVDGYLGHINRSSPKIELR